jgi:hypothetical protein
MSRLQEEIRKDDKPWPISKVGAKCIGEFARTPWLHASLCHNLACVSLRLVLIVSYPQEEAVQFATEVFGLDGVDVSKVFQSSFLVRCGDALMHSKKLVR